MHLDFKSKYTKLTDKELVDLIITPPYLEEGALYLIYNRYEPLCISNAKKVFGDLSELDSLQDELFALLKGPKKDWASLRSFQWKSTLGGWLHMTTYHLALKLKSEVIENGGKNVPLDKPSDSEDGKPIHREIPFNEEKVIERRYRMVLLQEAINKLENPDQRFVVLKRLEGYSSKEVADMLQAYWDSQGIIRYNNKHQIVKLDSGNIDNLFKRGYDKVVEIFKTLDR